MMFFTGAEDPYRYIIFSRVLKKRLIDAFPRYGQHKKRDLRSFSHLTVENLDKTFRTLRAVTRPSLPLRNSAPAFTLLLLLCESNPLKQPIGSSPLLFSLAYYDIYNNGFSNNNDAKILHSLN